MQHYFSEKPDTISKRKDIFLNFLNKDFIFTTDNGIFSKNHVDLGTLILLKEIIKNYSNKDFSVLDIGCGYGVVGTIIKTFYPTCTITLSDINERALDLSSVNLEKNNINKFNITKSNLYENISDTFDLIISNPPIRAGKKLIFELYQKSYEHLNENGVFFCVIMTKHGAKSTEKELKNIFQEVNCLNICEGYRVYMATKKGL